MHEQCTLGRASLVLCLTGILAALGLSGPAMADGPAQQYLDTQLRVVRSLEARVDQITRIADESAARLVSGGHIYAAGETGAVSELVGRAGGLCGIQALSWDRRPKVYGPNDVLLVADYGSSEPKPAWASQPGPLVVLFAPTGSATVRQPPASNVRVIDVPVPLALGPQTLHDGRRLMPAAAPAVATAQWAFTAELIAACRRRHQQLAVYLSIHLDPGLRRLARTRGLLFEPQIRPEPVAAGRYARQFLGQVGDAIQAVQAVELTNIRRAGQWIREAKAANRQVVRRLEGHLPPHEVGRSGDPDCFTGLNKADDEAAVKWARENLHPGDVYLLLGYQQNEDSLASAAHAAGARTIFVTSRGPGKEQSQNAAHLYVDPHWPLSDACLDLPSYDVKACPLSAILGLSVYYAICAEAEEK
jgi:uncharacterized phosphosugar-binding protein